MLHCFNRRIFRPVLVLCLAASARPAGAAPDESVVSNVAALLHESLVLLSEKSAEADTQYYETGLWRAKNDDKNWASMVGPGTAAAVLWKWQAQRLKDGTLPPALKNQATPEKQEWLRRVAIETFDRMLKDHQNPDGSLGTKLTPETYFAAVELATATFVLGDGLPPDTQARWCKAITDAVAYLVESNNLPNAALPGWKATDGWYTNGNIELGEAELVYLTWKITGDKEYHDLFEQQLKHALQPDPVRWKGFGLVTLQEPTKADGADGTGYLAESGGKEPGFDGDYAHFDVTVAGRFHALSRDPRVLRVLNLTINTLLPRTDPNTWILDATGGARHSLKFPFFSSGLAVAAWRGGRDDLAPKIPDQFAKAVRPSYHGNAAQSWGNPAFYRGYGCDLAVFLLADMAPPAM